MNKETIKLSKEQIKQFKSILTELIKNKKPNDLKGLFLLCCALRINKSFEALALLLEKRHVHEAYSTLRNLFETMIMLIAGWKHDNFEEFKSRLHANFIVDKIDLIDCNLQSLNRTKFESIEIVRKRKLKALDELNILERKGIKPFSKNPTDNLASISKLTKFKRHYYKLLSLYTHPNLHSIEKFIKYNEKKGTIKIVKNYKNDSEEGIRECIYNFIRISNSILISYFSLEFAHIDPNELLIKAENTFEEIDFTENKSL
jgi:hypothetical protein